VVKLAVVDSQEVEAAEEEAPLRTQTQSARLWQLGYQAARRCKIGFRKCGQAFKFLALPAVQLLGSSISCYHSSLDAVITFIALESLTSYLRNLRVNLDVWLTFLLSWVSTKNQEHFMLR